MPIGTDSDHWRRDLPHLHKNGKTHFITFCTRNRCELEPKDRDVALATIVRSHKVDYWLHCCVIMPDHLHLVFTIYEHATLPKIMQRIKSVSAHLMERGVIWQHEYFDRVIRADEDLRRQIEYVCMNPVRAGLVDSVDDYPWIWRCCVDGLRAPARPPAPH